MNKNWLYRVLAIALVAMLALPMFAMAEEATIELGGAQAVQKLTVDVDWWAPGSDVNATDLSTNTVALLEGVGEFTFNVDMGKDWLDYDVTTDPQAAYGINADDWAMGALTCTKNTNKSVLTCDKHNHITIKKPGKATLTFQTTNAFSGKKVTVKMKVVVTDSSKLKVGKEIHDPNDNSVTTGTLPKVWEITLGAPFGYTDYIDVDDSTVIADSSRVALRATVKDDALDDDVTVDYDYDDANAPVLGVSVPIDVNSVNPASNPICAYGYRNDGIYRIVTYKSSNKAAVSVDPWTGELYTKKMGNATITATLYDVDATGLRKSPYVMKTIKVKVKVVKNKTAAATKALRNAALAYAKDKDELFFGIQQAEFIKVGTSTSKLKVTYFVANGTDNTIKSVYGPGATVKYIRFANPMRASYGATFSDFWDSTTNYGVVLVDANLNPIATGKKSVNWKANSVSTFSHTYTIPSSSLVDLNDPASAIAVTEFVYSTAKGHDEQIWYFKGVED